MNIIGQLKTTAMVPTPPTGYGAFFVDSTDSSPKIKLSDGTISTLRGPSATVAVGNVVAIAANATPIVTNTGSNTQAILNFSIPGTPVITIGTTTKASLNGNATVTNTGTALAPVWNFTIPSGSKSTVTNIAMSDMQVEVAITNSAVSSNALPFGITVMGDIYSELSYETKVVSVSEGGWICAITACDPDGDDLSGIPLPNVSITYIV